MPLGGQIYRLYLPETHREPELFMQIHLITRVITWVITLALFLAIPSVNAAQNTPNLPIPTNRPTNRPAEISKPNAEVKTPAKPDANTAPLNRPSAANACLAELKRVSNAKPVVQPTPKDAECTISNPVSILSIRLQNGKIALPADMLNDCQFALEFSRWLADVANPLAEQHLGSSIKRLHSGTGFTCRRRNNLPTGKLSEHAFGNAIDIVGLTLSNGERFLVDDPATMEPSYARFFTALRKTACGYFTTVLGPGSNAAHATHLHLDLGIHGRTRNYRICE